MRVKTSGAPPAGARLRRGNVRTMAAKLQLTLACGDYEIVRALKEGAVEPDGIELTMVTSPDSTTRHWRFLRNREFDLAEVSSSSYIIARDQGMPFDAIPVFLHRRFRHGFAFVNTAKGIREPKDLIGKKVGVKSFQVTAVLWLRGILEQEYGVPHKSIEWFAEYDEDVEFAAPAGLKLTRLRDDQTCEDLLVSGELDAVLHPDLIWPITQKHPAVGRLFAGLQGRGRALLQEDRHLPHHACDGREERGGGGEPLGSHQPLQGLRQGQGHRHEAHVQPAHRAAGLVSPRLGGAAPASGTRPLGIWCSSTSRRAANVAVSASDRKFQPCR